MRIVGLTVTAVFFLLLIAGCSLHTPPPQARVRHGAAFGTKLHKLLALPTRCSVLSMPTQAMPTQSTSTEEVVSPPPETLCTRAQALAVDASTRMSLEFAGVRLVDSEVVNAYLRSRVVIEHDGNSQTEIESDQATWETTTVERRRELLVEMGVDGYLTSLITVGDQQNVEGQRTVTVTVTIIRAKDSVVAWTSQCSVETGRFYYSDEAVDVAAMCALESALLVGPA